MRRVKVSVVTLVAVMVATLLMTLAGCGGGDHHDRDDRSRYSEHERHDNDRHEEHRDSDRY